MFKFYALFVLLMLLLIGNVLVGAVENVNTLASALNKGGK